MDKSKAFTIIEIIVTISLVLILAVVAIPTYNTYDKQLKLKKETMDIFEVLKLAKKKAMSSDFSNPAVTPDPITGYTCDNFSGYRVSFNSGSYSLLIGCAGAYQQIQSYNISSPNTSIITATPFNIDFPPLGINTNIGVPTIRLKNTMISQCEDISLSQSGVIEVNQTLVSCP